MKKDTIAELTISKRGIAECPRFKGRAKMVRNISDKLDFLTRYKIEPRLEALSIK